MPYPSFEKYQVGLESVSISSNYDTREALRNATRGGISLGRWRNSLLLPAKWVYGTEAALFFKAEPAAQAAGGGGEAAGMTRVISGSGCVWGTAAGGGTTAGGWHEHDEYHV